MIEDQRRRRIEDLVDAGKTNSQISEETRYARSTVIRHANPYKARKLRGDAGHEEKRPKLGEPRISEKDGVRFVGLDIDRPIATEDELLEVCKLDKAIWRVKAWKCGAWNSVTKDAEKNSHLHGLFKVEAQFERIAPKIATDAIEAFFERYKDRSPVLKPINYRRDGEMIVEIDLCDVHFGKLAWRAETGQDYDLKIAEKVFRNAIEDLLVEISHLKIKRIVVLSGNDYTQVDSSRNTTTGGTPVDTDGRFFKICDVALDNKIHALYRFREIAETDELLIPGNHDGMTAYMLARAAKEHFRNDSGVNIDCTPGPRKYKMLGKTLVGYQHGHNLSDSRVKDLPAVMMREAPREMIALADYHEWHIGHRHSERKFTTKDVDTNIGVVTRYMHSLSAVDAWHSENHFIGARRAAEAHWYHEEQGYKGHALALARH